MKPPRLFILPKELEPRFVLSKGASGAFQPLTKINSISNRGSSCAKLIYAGENFCRKMPFARSISADEHCCRYCEPGQLFFSLKDAETASLFFALTVELCMLVCFR